MIEARNGISNSQETKKNIDVKLPKPSSEAPDVEKKEMQYKTQEEDGTEAQMEAPQLFVIMYVPEAYVIL